MPVTSKKVAGVPVVAWVVAAAAGLALGFVLLRRSSSSQPADAESAERAAASQGAQGATVVQPLDDTLSALGLTAPTSEPPGAGGQSGYTGGGSSSGGSSDTTSSSLSLGAQTFTRSQASSGGVSGPAGAPPPTFAGSSVGGLGKPSASVPTSSTGVPVISGLHR